MLPGKLEGLAVFWFIAIPLLWAVSIHSAVAALAGDASQATLALSPEAGSFNQGDNFSISIYINTHNENVVAVAAYLIYDKAHFDALSIDNSSSVFTMEAEKAIDPANGVIRISMGKPTPGVNASSGLLAKINFKALSAVTPSSDNFLFNFTPGSTLESNAIKDDGLGTEILSGVYNGRYAVSSSADVTGDGMVDIQDLSLVGSNFGKKTSDAEWDPAADADSNGEIDIYDLVFVASRFT